MNTFHPTQSKKKSCIYLLMIEFIDVLLILEKNLTELIGSRELLINVWKQNCHSQILQQSESGNTFHHI